MTTYNFFIEKSNYQSNELMLHLDYPIECTEKERLVLKLVDFKYLNSAYNISGALDNNKFNITSFIAGYDEYFTSDVGGNYTYPGHIVGNSTFLDNFTRHPHLETMEEILIGNDYSIYYGMPLNQPQLLEGYTPQGQPLFYAYLLPEMFREAPSYTILPFDLEHQNYIKIFKKHTTVWDDKFILQNIYVHMMFSNEGNVNQYGATININFKVEASDDNVTYFTLPVSNNTITFAPYTPTSSTYINITNTTAYKYYKISILSRNFAYSNNLIVLDKMLFYKAYNYIENTPEINTSTLVTIPDGFYNADNLISTINATSSQITMTKQLYTNKITITNETPITVINVANPPQVIPELRQLKFINKTTANMYGFNDVNIILNNAPITSDKYINIMNFSKIIISTDLTFPENTTNDISNDKSVYTKGIGNIIEWVDISEPPFSCIIYKNIEGTTNKINDKFLQSFKIMFCTEKSMPLVLDNFTIHLQIIKYKK